MTAAELAATSTDGVAYGLLLFTVAVGLTLILGVMGVMNLAHGTLYLLGAYLGYALTDGTLLGLAVAVGAAIVVGAGGGALLDVLLRPVHDHRRQALVTLGVAFLAVAGFNAAFGGSPLPADPPTVLAGSVALFGHGYPVYRLVFIAVAALIAADLHLLLRHTPTGARLRAVVADPAMAAATGIRTRAVRIGALAVGGALAVAAGVLGVAAGLVVVRRGWRWPAMGRRYERPGGAAEPGPRLAAAPTTDEERAAAWQALDRGQDPTAGARASGDGRPAGLPRRGERHPPPDGSADPSPLE